MRTRHLLAAPGLAGLILLTCLAAAADEPKKEDPKPEAKAEPKVELPPDVVPSTFRMFLVSDKRFEPLKDVDGKPLKGPDGKDVPSPKNREGKTHCLVCEYGLNPVVAVFVRADPTTLGADSGVGKLARGIDALIPRHRADKLAGFLAFLRLDFKDEKGMPPKTYTKVVTVKKKVGENEVEEKVEQDLEYPDDENRAKYVQEVGDLAKALNVPNLPIGLAPEKSRAITAWKIGDDEVTVVLYYRMRVIGQPWRFKEAKDLTDDKVAEILKAAEAMFAEKR